MLTEGPAEWRVVDELRAEKRNWFYMDSLTVQFFKIPCGFQEEVIPVDPRSTIGDVAFWDQIPILTNSEDLQQPSYAY